MTTMSTSTEKWRATMKSADQSLKEGDFHVAEALLLQAYESGLKLFGPDHGSVGLVLLRLAEVAFKTGRNDLGRSYQMEVDRIVELYIAD
jgi:hypothetical protein